MKSFAKFAVLSVLLVACPRVEPIEYSLNAVLPSPALPGDVVTVFGTLPQNPTLKLGDQSLTPTIIADGLTLTIPTDAVAGATPVFVEGDKQKLEGSVTISPRVDAAVLEGAQLRIAGSGWAKSGDLNASVIVGGVVLTPERANNDLVVALPAALPYGAFDVVLTVNEVTSSTVRISREAGAVKGSVVLPAPVEAVAANVAVARSMQVTQNANVAAFTVFHSSALPNLELLGLRDTLELPSLKATQFSFDHLEAAHAAFAQFERLGLKLEWSASMSTSDGLVALSSSAPASPGAGQWHLPLLGLPDAWRSTKGAGVVVAVVDTGVNLTHPDLLGNLLPGYDFVEDDTAPQDIVGHGSHVAGLVAANGLALGVAKEAKILPVRVLRDFTASSDGPVAQGILWAAGLLDGVPNPNPAQVINLSLGSNSRSSLIEEAIFQVLAKGVIVIAASGNSGESFNSLAFPASMPGVIAVTALAGPVQSYQPTYAQKGVGLWVSAFGGDMGADQNLDQARDGILSLDLQGGYSLRMGTSMATPQVAGAAALALASGTPAGLVRQALAKTATDLGVRGYDARYGYGLVSTRVSTPLEPRVYVLALDSSNKIQTWSLVTDDSAYLMGNLSPSANLKVLAASDADNDGVLGEAGELVSEAVSVTVQSAKVLNVSALTLNPSSGAQTWALEATK
jgi:serine protease